MNNRPKCPNHEVGMDKTDEPRYWICPISGARFECEVEQNEDGEVIKLNTFGQPVRSWVVHQADGGMGG